MPRKFASVPIGDIASAIGCGMDSLSAYDIYLTVRYSLKRADGLMPAGTELAYDQICLNEAVISHKNNCSGKPEHGEEGGLRTFSGKVRKGGKS